MNLVGMGERTAAISYDVLAPPDEIVGGTQPTRPRPTFDGIGRGDGAVARGSVFEKGSLLVFSKVEVRFNEFGEVTQDTFIQLTNDFGEDVRVQMMFVNGDDPMLEVTPNDICEHPGWNWVDNEILLTGNQTTFWSAASGNPAGVSPWTILDP